MKSTIGFLLLFVGLSAVTFAQNNFKVLTTSGQSLVNIEGNKSELKSGMILSGEFTLELRDDAYLGLVHSSGSILEIRKEGEHSSQDLFRQIDPNKTNTIISRYAEYLIDKMDEASVNRRLTATGGVERSYDPLSKYVRLYIPKETDVYGEEVTIEWDEENVSSVVEVLDLYEKVLYADEVKGKRYSLNLNETALASNQKVLIKVKQGADKSSSPVLLKKMNVQERAVHAANLEKISQNYKNSAIREMFRAAYFEDNNLLADAFTSYVNAMLMEPEISGFTEAYEAFLVRNQKQILTRM